MEVHIYRRSRIAFDMYARIDCLDRVGGRVIISVNATNIPCLF